MVERSKSLLAKRGYLQPKDRQDYRLGFSNGGEGGSTANFVSSLIKSLPPVHDVAKMAGVDLPDYLGSMKEE